MKPILHNAVNTFTFLSLLILACQVSAQSASTVGEIYDFEVNDKFHIHESGSSPYGGFGEYKNIRITGKYYSADADTVFYSRSIHSYYESSDNPWGSYSSKTDTVFYTDLNALILNGYIDTVYYNSEKYNGRKINANLYHPSYYDFEYKYIEGCGGPYKKHSFSNDEGDETSYDYVLFYFQKGEEEWGTPHDVTSISEIESPLNLRIYPNPASNKLSVGLPDSNTSAEGAIFSISGQLIQAFSLSAGSLQELDVSMLSSGLYTIQLTTSDAVYSGTFVKN